MNLSYISFKAITFIAINIFVSLQVSSGQDGLIRDPAKAIPEAEQAAINFVANVGPCHKGMAVLGVGEALLAQDNGNNFISNRFFCFDIQGESSRDRYFSLAREGTPGRSNAPRVIWIERIFRNNKLYWREYLQSSGPQGQAIYDLNAPKEDGQKPSNLFQPFVAYSWTIGSMPGWSFNLLDADFTQQMIIELADLKTAEYEDDGDVVATWQGREKKSGFTIRFDRNSGMMPISFVLRATGKKTEFDVLVKQPPAYQTSIAWKKFRDDVWRPVLIAINEGSKDTTLRQTTWRFEWLNQKELGLSLPETEASDWRKCFTGDSMPALPDWIEGN